MTRPDRSKQHLNGRFTSGAVVSGKPRLRNESERYGSMSKRADDRSIARTANVGIWHLEGAWKAAEWLRVNGNDVAKRYNTDRDEAISGVSYDTKSRQSGPSRPCESRAIDRRADDITKAGAALKYHLAEGHRHSKDAEKHFELAERAGRALLAIPEDEAKRLSEAEEIKHDPNDETRSLQCNNPDCLRVVSNTPNDRLRKGRCDACRVYFDRHGIERPKHLCAIGADVLSSDALGLDVERLIVEDVA